MEEMNRYKSLKLLLIAVTVIFLSIFVPIIINVLMFNQGFIKVHGSEDTWISSLSSFYGSIISGVISGLLTLIGVRITIKSSLDAVNKTIKEQQQAKKEELEYNAVKEQFYKFYHPLNALLNSFSYEHNAHDFTHLRKEQINEFMNLIIENDTFAEEELYIKLMEIRWAYNNKDYEDVNRLYNEVETLVFDTTVKIKKKLNLPIYNID